MIVINFKNYKFGNDALELAKKIEKYLSNAIIAVSAVDIGHIVYHTKFPAGHTILKVFAQHIDVAISGNRSTGFVTAEAVKAHGASGTLLNHSEHQLEFGVLQATLGDIEDAKLKSVVCVPTLKEAKRIIKLKPYAMAFEDVELIATNKSITNYRTDEIKEFVKMLKGSGIIPLCGAGINSADDIKQAYNLGCGGVLIASAIANTKNPEKLLKEIAEIKHINF